jgi:hypothetical protein
LTRFLLEIEGNMRGMILGFDEPSGKGVISTQGGERLLFSRPDWRATTSPTLGLSIDFTMKDGRATDVYPVPEGGASGAGITVKSPEAQRAFKLGVISLICAFVGVIIPLLGVILAVVSFVTGRNAFRQGRQHNEQAGQYMGLVGAIVSGLTILLYVVTIIFWAFVGTGLGFFMGAF